MKKNILLMLLFIMFMGCETGTRYDKNSTKQKVPKSVAQSGLVDRDDIEALLDDKEELLNEEQAWVNTQTVKEEDVEELVSSFSNTVLKNTLDVVKIREGKHESYLRLVFDVYDKGVPSTAIGAYDAKYISSEKDITVILHGYQKFSAPLPSFPSSSVVEQIYFEQYPKNKGFKFHVKLRQNAKVKIFELKNPARLVFDIKPI